MNPKETSVQVLYGQEVDITNPNLVELIKEGYKFDTSILSEDFIGWRGKVEYHFAEIVYLATVQNREVGSLSINTRPNTLEDSFWRALRERRPALSNPNLLAIYMQGVIIHPLFQHHGIASYLLRTMVDYYNPSIILGQTKTPEAVGVRAKVLAGLGFRSFYGYCEVTPECDFSKESDGLDFINAAFAAEQFTFGQTTSDRGVYFVDPDILPSYMPDTNDLSLEIQRSFRPIIEAQESIGRLETAASVLVSIKTVDGS